jgi:glycosyltransferase involved in cell wall biosynthesis
MARLTSIVLPTYNRAAFLPDALRSITGQENGDWELIVVDDGSTDDTAAVVHAFADVIGGRLQYIRQANQGAYPARNTGIRAARGDYVAFFDSDDLWLPHHLSRCAEALDAHPDLDWVYGACRMVNYRTGEEISPSTFRVNGATRPFMRLKHNDRGTVRIIDDPRLIECAVLSGLYCGLQNSVIRRKVFADRLFDVSFHNEAEDQVFPLRSVLSGFHLGYIDDVHVIYRVHESNSTAPGAATVEKRMTLTTELARGYEELARNWSLGARSARAVRRRLNREYFWHAGYAILWQNGRHLEALEMFRRGLRVWPWDIRCWKTYSVAWLRTALGRTTRTTIDG